VEEPQPTPATAEHLICISLTRCCNL
jgi:hypothetical protein